MKKSQSNIIKQNISVIIGKCITLLFFLGIEEKKR